MADADGKMRIEKCPRFADTFFASRFFELLTLPASLRLNTQRRSAPSMRAFKEEERSVLISVTLLRFSQTYELLSSKAAFTIAFFAVVNHNYDHKQRTLKHRNTLNGSKSTNPKSQTLTF